MIQSFLLITRSWAILTPRHAIIRLVLPLIPSFCWWRQERILSSPQKRKASLVLKYLSNPLYCIRSCLRLNQFEVLCALQISFLQSDLTDNFTFIMKLKMLLTVSNDMRTNSEDGRENSGEVGNVIDLTIQWSYVTYFDRCQWHLLKFLVRGQNIYIS